MSKFFLVIPKPRDADSRGTTDLMDEVRTLLIEQLRTLGGVINFPREDAHTSGTHVRPNANPLDLLEYADLVVADITFKRGDVREGLIAACIHRKPIVLVHSADTAPSIPPELIESRQPLRAFAYNDPSDLVSNEPHGPKRVHAQVETFDSVSKIFNGIPRATTSLRETIQQLLPASAPRKLHLA